MNKKRTIITMVVMILIIALLIILVIAAATSRQIPKGENGNSLGSSEIAQKEDHTINSNVEDENLPPVSNENDSALAKTEPNQKPVDNQNTSNQSQDSQTASESTTSSIDIAIEEKNLPHSGPESALPLALILGTLTTFVFSCSLVREKYLL